MVGMVYIVTYAYRFCAHSLEQYLLSLQRKSWNPTPHPTQIDLIWALIDQHSIEQYFCIRFPFAVLKSLTALNSLPHTGHIPTLALCLWGYFLPFLFVITPARDSYEHFFEQNFCFKCPPFG